MLNVNTYEPSWNSILRPKAWNRILPNRFWMAFFIKEEYVPIEYYRIETNGINGGLLKMSQTPQRFGTNAFLNSIQVKILIAQAS